MISSKCHLRRYTLNENVDMNLDNLTGRFILLAVRMYFNNRRLASTQYRQCRRLDKLLFFFVTEFKHSHGGWSIGMVVAIVIVLVACLIGVIVM